MKRLALAAPLVLTLVACGPSDPAGGRPEDGGAAAPAKPSRGLSDAEKTVLLASLPAPYDAADLANGRRVFARCRSCHTIGEGGPDMAGPNLHGVFGRKAGDRPRYNYSNVMRTATFTWDAEKLDHWLQNPRTFLPGNKMSFPGLPDATDRRDVIAFLKVETGYRPETPATPAS
ncbi:cytochrome c family protein [Brevundimonas sp.]|uniref:c-type cytochrome n=1 Tax=Brevundimonas sp. TaxID=1871086 RepID=UPI00185864B8|nr:cytochrome c family protein [Brevundimonas sp.]MBA4806939.1 cytochrome c family protein [Brevundimonas sp.]